ncbi:carboxynorspermidine decarboxylase [Corticibacter populi]|uniref:Carboxynorspermidine/carboxyspermidine decarboxylase n=1 Tax=Corticibacter populi TaxID=1550736 RepID=A0A3M6QU88_9BURK|nr:carboxynorspermidine decarboxylase [Corticibacter populi]RMX06042.1 carboxynorspermidine decarboxylase [Corticibacter populi]
MQRIARLRTLSGAKALLALKCFATWSVFPLMRQYLDGSTSSSLNEVRLGREKFGGETHAYSVAWADHEIDAVLTHGDKIIFNSLAQLQRFGDKARAAGKPVGLRVNPGVSNSPYLLADPARPNSRLGESDPDKIAAVIGQLSGLMFHNNCENRRFEHFDEMLGHIEQRFGHLLAQVQWISLGGGIHFSEPGYPLEQLAERLRRFAGRHGVQVYLEPGEASVAGAATLEVTVLDVGFNGKPLAVVDSSIEAHMLDLLIYDYSARIEPNTGEHETIVGGKTCLAGDLFGTFRFTRPLQVGDRLSIEDAAGYTMVKKNWFNGVDMPAIVVRRLDGREEVVRAFGYDDYVGSLS